MNPWGDVWGTQLVSKVQGCIASLVAYFHPSDSVLLHFPNFLFTVSWRIDVLMWYHNATNLSMFNRWIMQCFCYDSFNVNMSIFKQTSSVIAAIFTSLLFLLSWYLSSCYNSYSKSGNFSCNIYFRTKFICSEKTKNN